MMSEPSRDPAFATAPAPAPASASASGASPARRLGRYRIHRHIASGGMASVHVANTDTKEGFTKIFALKVIHEHLARDPSFVQMFLDEARIAAQIEHANVCSVVDYGECDGSYYIAMEYMVGETFAAVRDNVRRRAYPTEWPRIAASLVAQACEGLHAAHSLRDADGALVGLVHRDVSPQNLFVTYSGVAKVMDFGIARTEGRSQHTAPGVIKGKFAYLAPEQLTAADRVDRRADVWALGVTLWELLTLRPLFKGPGAAETLTAVMSRSIAAPSVLRPGIPRELDRVVLRALSRDPEARFRSARELGRALAVCFAGSGGLADAVELEEWLERAFPDGRSRHSLSASIGRELAELRANAGITSSEFEKGEASGSHPGVVESMVVMREPADPPRPGTPDARSAAGASDDAGTRSLRAGLFLFACAAAALIAAFLTRALPPNPSGVGGAESAATRVAVEAPRAEMPAPSSTDAAASPLAPSGAGPEPVASEEPGATVPTPAESTTRGADMGTTGYARHRAHSREPSSYTPSARRAELEAMPRTRERSLREPTARAPEPAGAPAPAPAPVLVSAPSYPTESPSPSPSQAPSPESRALEFDPYLSRE